MEDYVDYPTARLLKEAGFDWKCAGYYYIPEKRFSNVYPTQNYNESVDFQSAPTLAQAQKWLRNIHGVHVESRFVYNGLFDLVILSENRNLHKRFINMGWINYEAALSAGINKALN